MSKPFVEKLDKHFEALMILASAVVDANKIQKDFIWKFEFSDDRVVVTQIDKYSFNRIRQISSKHKKLKDFFKEANGVLEAFIALYNNEVADNG